MKKIISLALAIMLMLSAVSLVMADSDNFITADGVVEEQYVFPFTDVKDTAWYRADVEIAHKRGLISGKTATTFVPGDNMTVAEAVKLAACMHELYNIKEISLKNGVAPAKWYSTYMSYALDQQIISEDLSDRANEKITRREFVKIFYEALPEGEYMGDNSVPDNSIPDVRMADECAEQIYAFYRGGILTGSDDMGTFNPESNIVRSEVAAILTRMFDNTARKAITLSSPVGGSELFLNSLSKLVNEKKLTVGYIGGSVTDGSGASNPNMGSWRGQTRDWLREEYYGEAEIVEVMASQGATGVAYGIFRAENQLIKDKAPDLTFIEFAINDVYDGTVDLHEHYVYIEALLRKIYASNPTADVVFVITGDYSSLKEDVTKGEKLFGHEYAEIAEYYHIPVIYPGHELAKKIYAESGNIWPSNRGLTTWGDYFKDSVHPNDTGYRHYTETIKSFLEPYLLSDYKPSPSECTAKVLPEETFCQVNGHNRGEYTVERMMSATIVGASVLEGDSFGDFARGEAEGQLVPMVSTAKGDKITLEFNSANIGLWIGTPDGKATTISYSIDGGKAKTLRVQGPTRPFFKLYSLATGLDDGKVHTLEITHTEDGGLKIYGFTLWGTSDGKLPVATVK